MPYDPYTDNYSAANGGRRLYRSRTNVKLLGVCAGFADYFQMPVKTVRVLTVIIAIVTGLWPLLIAYIITGMVMKPAPDAPIASEEQADFWNQCYRNPQAAMARIRTRRADLERRLQRLESIVTSPKFDLEQQLRNL